MDQIDMSTPELSRSAVKALRRSWIPFVGMIIGRLALKDIRWTGQGGRHEALWAIRINAAVTAVFVGGLVAISLPGGSDQVAVTDLKAHQCYVLTHEHEIDPHNGIGTLDKVRRVGCGSEHDGEVVGVWDAGRAWSDYPDDQETLESRASQECDRLTHGYARDFWRIPDGSTERYFAPTRSGWRYSGIHQVVCSVESNGAKGTLYQDPAVLGPHRTAYLDAENALDIVRAQVPDSPTADGAMSEWTVYAVHMASAEEAMVRALKAHQWPSDAAGPIAQVEASAQRAAAAWTKADGDREPNAVDRDAKAAEAIDAATPYDAARGSLHLTVSDPAPVRRV
ncbi:Septum formation [Actinacidiphila yanglinensis]|uniref:Septum formation n=2 Tax=Actinacidiphila yanglinensis TaxID=310779 RepID=A0A1H6DLV1_9ACTN|nr:Septum formation [Actinacidiphila yanglinensis]